MNTVHKNCSFITVRLGDYKSFVTARLGDHTTSFGCERIAQLACRASNKRAGCKTDAGSVPWYGKGFFSQSPSSADSLTVSVQPPYAAACISIGAHVKNPKGWQLHHCLTCENTAHTHTLIGMGLTDLAAAVPYPGRTTRISCKGYLIDNKKQKYLYL